MVLVTWPMFHAPTGWLKVDALENMPCSRAHDAPQHRRPPLTPSPGPCVVREGRLRTEVLVTLAMFHAPTGWLKEDAS